MSLAILLLACLVLAAAVLALGVALRDVRERVRALETSPVRSPGIETGASAPSSTSDPSVEQVPQRPSRDHEEPEEFVITKLGEEPEEPAPVLEARLFADVVLRETVVKVASLAHGLRRGLSPANRNRIWFEMRREVKRARKDRKAEEREAIREWRARQRAGQAGRHAQREDDAA